MDGFHLVWTAPGLQGDMGRADAYEILYREGAGIPSVVFAHVPVPRFSGGLEYYRFRARGLKSYQEYSVAVRSKHGDKVSDLSNYVSGATLSGAPPENFRTTATVPKPDSHFTLRWDPARGNITGYDLIVDGHPKHSRRHKGLAASSPPYAPCMVTASGARRLR